MIYSTEQVAAYAGVTLRQLQYWDEQKLLTPFVNRGWRHGRRYTEDQATKAYFMGESKRKGMTVQELRPIIKQFGRGLDRGDLLVWDGKKLHHLNSDECTKLIELMDRAPRACTLVRIHRLISQGAA